ncbi:ATP9B [Hepatospora eriocheir]|nr:ATP9B [Hepatospora eriocheir]
MQAIFSALISSYPISVLQKNMSIYFITFTSIPLFALFGCYDVIPRISKNYPELYHEMKINRLCSLKEFVFNNLIAYITGVIISLYFAVSKVNERSLFSVCIFLSSMINEYFMILIVQVNRFGITFIFIIVSLFLFFALNSKFPEFEVRLMLDKDFIGKLLLINILAMLPKLIIKTAQVYLKPSSHIKLSRKENANLINSTNKF